MHPWLLFRDKLREENLDPNPIRQFARWLKSARWSFTTEFPNAVCLSTLGPDAFPESRMVLLKGFDEKGFVFYTNLESIKGQSLLKNPRAALCFY
ncbi:MAG: pyridoxamine 5'-phosphate oxidase, partial [SAR324 cluster bacterium]|nr:pyridoxamine 5'-phosphate oxidase [SAR324 cluster bacterium]